MKVNIILISIVVLFAITTTFHQAYSVEYRPFIGKSITFQQPTEIRFLGGKVERKTLIDSCSLGNSISSRVGRFSASIALSIVNVYDKYNGITTRKSALIKGLGGGLFRDKNYYGVYWFDRNKELGFKNAFGIVYNRYF